MSSSLDTPIALPPLHASTLPNGLTVQVASRDSLPLVTARLDLKVGAAIEPAEKAGLASFAAGLLRRGTLERSASELNAAVERLGGRLWADADHDVTSVQVSLPSEHLETGLAILAETVLTPAFAAREVAAARDRLLDGINSELDDGGAMADKALQKHGLAGHPYGRPSYGLRATVEKLDRKSLVAHHRFAFSPDRAVLTVVGDAKPDLVAKRLAKLFGAWKRASGEVPAIPEAKATGGGRVVLVDNAKATQSQLRFGGPGVPIGDPQRFACTLASSVLGGGFTSRLMQEIRVNRGLSYGASCRFDRYPRGGTFSVSTFTQNDRVSEAIEVALATTRSLSEKLVPAEELERTKTYLCGLYPLNLETNDQVARILAELWLHDLPSDGVARYRDRIRAVTPEQVREVARRFFFTEAPLLVVAGPAKALKKSLGAFGKVEVISAESLA